MGPLLSAALAGDVELVKSLVEAKCQALPKPGFHGDLYGKHMDFMRIYHDFNLQAPF